jgi:hypothetical protein
MVCLDYPPPKKIFVGHLFFHSFIFSKEGGGGVTGLAKRSCRIPQCFYAIKNKKIQLMTTIEIIFGDGTAMKMGDDCCHWLSLN